MCTGFFVTDNLQKAEFSSVLHTCINADIFQICTCQMIEGSKVNAHQVSSCFGWSGCTTCTVLLYLDFAKTCRAIFNKLHHCIFLSYELTQGGTPCDEAAH